VAGDERSDAVPDGTAEAGDGAVPDGHVDAGAEVSSLHGCQPQEPSPECGGVQWTCTKLRVCCHGYGGACLMGNEIPPDSGVVASLAPCWTDEMCAAKEYCYEGSRCCPVGYTCFFADASVGQ
jgi:hypothetical protein